MSTGEDRPRPTSGGGRRVPPFNSTGGDLVDQVREGVDRLRERLADRFRRRQDPGTVAPERRPVRRTSFRSQAVPLGSSRASAVRPRVPSDRRAGTAGRADRAERSTYTLVFAAVLLAAVVGLFFTLSWALGAGGPFGSSPVPTPKPTAPAGLGSPAPVSSPAPLTSPSPAVAAPEPSPPASPVTGRVHVVVAGDTLNKISQQYGVTVEAIMQANNFTDRNRILRIGERLVIPDSPPGSPVPR